MTFDQAVAFVLRHEGRESRDPRDPGGYTRFGISQRAHPDVNVEALTEPQAIALYRRDYWDKLQCDALPPALRLAVFDAAVQHGAGPAVRMLQLCIDVAADGLIGPETIRATHGLPWAPLLVDYLARRGRLYATQGAVAVFALGWFRRLFDLFRQVHESAMSHPGGTPWRA